MAGRVVPTTSVHRSLPPPETAADGAGSRARGTAGHRRTAAQGFSQRCKLPDIPAYQSPAPVGQLTTRQWLNIAETCICV